MAAHTSTPTFDLISQPVSKIVQHHYTVVVIGSGYGGAIAASRLARARDATGRGPSICVLERGREIRPGEYPDTRAKVQAESQVTTGRGHVGVRTGLFDLRVGEDVSVLIGCGLGGTSLINANVALEVDRRLFADEKWPSAFRRKADLLDPYYARARAWLGSTPYPDGSSLPYPSLPKLEALEASGHALRQPVYRPPINVTFADGPNRAGVHQAACILCGDCVTGCNAGAKNTTLMNYLPDAHHHGAEIYTHAHVRYLEPDGEGWKIHVESWEGDEGPGQPVRAPIILTADIVVLGAGTLGSTEILLRSRAQGLALSDRLGQRFSCNGDALAFGYNSDWTRSVERRSDTRELPALPLPTGSVNDADQRPEIHAVGAGDRALPVGRRPGPCITGIIDLRDPKRSVADGLVIEEGVIPGAFAALAPAVFFFADALEGDAFAYSDGAQRLADAQELGNAIRSDPARLPELAFQGPVARTQSYLAMSHDSAAGRLELAGNTLRVRWPGAGREPVYARVDRILRAANEAIRGTYIPNPLWSEALGKRVITVHPIGGCGMGDSGATGVVNDKGQVFRDSRSDQVYQSLYVCDGAVMPGALAVNPLLTISAIAERTSELLARDRGWTIDYDVPARREGRVTMHRSARAAPTAVAAPPEAVAAAPALDLGIATALAPLFKEAIDSVLAQIEQDLMTIMRPTATPAEKQQAEADLMAQVTRLMEDFPLLFSPGLSFTERMTGFFSSPPLSHPAHASPAGLADLFDIADKYGKAAGLMMVAELTVKTPNLHRLVTDPDHSAPITGTVTCPALFPLPMPVTGTFQLLVPDVDRVETWNMVYTLDLERRASRPMRLEGTKVIHQRPGSSWWADLTTLRVTLFETTESGAPVVGRGILRLGLDDFIHQGSSVALRPGQVVATIGQLLKDKEVLLKLFRVWHDAEAAFTKMRNFIELVFAGKLAGFFVEVMFRAYGGLLADLVDFPSQDNPAPPRRALAAPRPEVHSVLTEDRVELQLTRYQPKDATGGPVILAPGFGVLASSFATDTVATNVVEYLTGAGFDVWLFDYRASAALTTSTPPSFTIDDIASYDWPAAVRYVCRQTDQADVQVLAHCVGSMTLLMALLRGMKGVRSAICCQLTLHPVSGWLNHLKADLNLVQLVERSFGVTEIDLRSSPRQASKAIDAWLWNVPVPLGEECKNPVCRRVFSVYGPTFVHDQLNAATHTALREMFGKLHAKPFEQMALITRRGRVVDHLGHDTYLTAENAQNLTMPLTFVAGRRNQIFYPETSELTLAWLRAMNVQPPNFYKRRVFADYAHMDFFIGKDAARDVFPYFVDRLKQPRARSDG